jgi:glycosyltransferase involved in cell wall biosynthesis
VPHRVAQWAIPLIIPRLYRLLARQRYDVVHCHLFGANLLGNSLAALCRVPVRLTHDQTNDVLRHRSFLHRQLDMFANRRTHHIVAVSSSIRAFLCQEEGIPADKVSVIYNAVDLERFTPKANGAEREQWRRTWGLPAEALVVGGIGRLHYQKNFPLFLEVAAAVSARIPEAVFVIAGEGPDLAALEELSRKLGLATRVRFLGFIKEMAELYQNLDLLLLTSHFEGTPLTVLEALAMGVPVVASEVDGVAEVLEDGRDACLVPPGRRDLFVEEVCRVLQDRALRQRLSRTGQETVRRHHSAEAMVRQVEDLYLHYLEGGRGHD